MGLIAMILLGYYVVEILHSYNAARSSLHICQTRAKLLNDLHECDTGWTFINDKNVSSLLNHHFVNTYYSRFIKFITKDIHYVQMKFHKIDLLLQNCADLNIISTGFSLFLNLPWWTNVINLTAQITIKLVEYKPTLFFIRTVSISHGLVGAISVLIHFCHLVIDLIAQKK
jgi:hypothetical protein